MSGRVPGKRIADGELPVNVGEYSKHVGWRDEPERVYWQVHAPVTGLGVGNLVNHHVEEHEDGTISVVPGGGGTSNSILLSNSRKSWHGYIYRGEWEEA